MEASTSKSKISGNNGEGIDRISSLPDDVLHHILSFLYIFDVVQLSVLSKRWKYIWTTMPNLHFDIGPFCRERRNHVKKGEKFKDFINWVLISQRETKLFSFRLRAYGFDFLDKLDVLRWIHAATRRNVQQLVLRYSSDEPFELPFCLVTCESLQVLKLELHWDILKVPNYFGFRHLKSLYLDVELSDEHFPSCFFSKCPLLETLVLNECSVEGLTILDISSSSLIYVTILYVNYLGPGIYDNCQVKISCPNLKLLKYEAPMPKDMIIENLSSIEDVHIVFIYIRPLECTGIFVHKMIKEVSSTSVLTLSRDCILIMYEAIIKQRLSPISFYKLKTLKVNARVDEDFMQALILLLKYCPNLEVLQLWFLEDESRITKLQVHRGDESFECMESHQKSIGEGWTKNCQMQIPDESIVCLESHLKSIRLTDFRGYGNEIEVLRFFVKNALVLEKLTICWIRYAFWAEYTDKSGEAWEKVLKLPKTSSQVALTFLDAKPKPRCSNWYDVYPKMPRPGR